MDSVPPPEPSGFEFYIASGLAWPWDRLSMHLVPKVAEQRLYSWTVVVVAPASQQVTVSWDASGAPADISPSFTEVDVQTAEPVGDFQDMKTTTSVVVEAGRLVPVAKAFEFRFEIGFPDLYDYATAGHITETGAITNGSYMDTQDQDNLSERLTEVIIERGKPSKRHDELSHVWTFEVTGGKSVVFFVDACKTSSPDGDNFVFSYSTDGVSYVEMLTVSTILDHDSYQWCPLSDTVKGTVYVRVQDTDRSVGNQNLDALYVDHMFILCSDCPPDLPPEAPHNLAAVAGDGIVTLDWDDNLEFDLDHYSVCRSLFPDGPYVWVADSLESIHVDNNVDNGTRYYYVVKAVDMAAQESGFSNVASATPGVSTTIRLASIEMSPVTAGRKWSAEAALTVLCQNGYPVEGATVSYAWTGVHKGTGEVSTGSDGVAIAVSEPSPKSGTTVFTVTGVSKTHCFFDEEASVKSSSITYP